MANAKSNFKKAVAKAKGLYKSGRYKTFADAVKAAYKTIGAVSSYRQTGSSKRKADRKRKAKPPGKRRSATGKVYYERRKNRSDKPGTLSGVMSTGRKLLKEKLDRLVLRKYHATKKAAKRKLQKEISAVKTTIKKFQ